ncbi:MAG TPA: ABC transporter permease [Bryobacteraceae bacterium]|nr:ABC transporter permease [Bryobacteraceae bacterium]
MSHRGPRPVAISLRLYRALAGAFPYEFKNVYGEELLQVTEDAIEEIWRKHGARGLLRLLADIAVRVPAEHLAELKQDVRYGLRALAASPGFTAVALISLSLGIAIATCAFSELNEVALRNLPEVPRPDELVALQLPVSFPSYRRFREQRDLFSSTAAYVAPAPFSVSVNGGAERMWGHLVTASYFATLGVRPVLGRFFDPAQEQPGQAASVVVSYRFWQQRLGADASFVGKSVRINGQPVTVIGVAPLDFLGASPLFFPADLWIPVSVGGRVAPELAGDALERWDLSMFRVVGRLQKGVAAASAEAALDAVARQIEQENGDANRNRKGRRVRLVQGGKVLPLRKQDVPFFSSFFLVMAGLVMLIACANVANMMLARAAGRRREIAVRLSLGASRARLIRQLLTESLIVSAGAGVLGFLASAWLLSLSLQVRMPLPMPLRYDFRPDGRVLLFTMALTMLTGLVFGLAPALEATRADLAPALKRGGNVLLGRHRALSLRNVLMVSQLAGSLALLVILGILALGIQTTLGIQAGFDPHGLYLISLDPVRDGYSAREAADFFEKLLDRVHRLPSIASASLTETVPVSMAGAGVTFAAVGTGGGGVRQMQSAGRHVVGKDYFDTTGIPILAGRSFRREDETGPPRAVIVSEALVRQVWPGEDPLGRRIEIENVDLAPPLVLPGSFDFRPQIIEKRRLAFEVVGVAGDVGEGLIVQKPPPVIYFPLRTADYARPSLEGVTLMIRGVPGADAIGSVRREIAAMSQQVTPFHARSMPEQIEQFMGVLRMAAWTYGVVGVFGLILASVGLAGVTAYSVTQRAREIGIRMALGARPGNVLALVMREGLALVAAGTLLGLAGAWAGSRMLAAISSTAGRVNSTSTSDPVVLFGAPLLLAALALAACYLPARRSMGIDPAVVLRQE